MKKIKIYNLFIFMLGLVSLSIGVLLIIKANFGVSVATSPPYVLSLYFTGITFGQWNYIAHGFVLLLLVLVVRMLTIKYLMSFLISFLFGVTIDLLNPLIELVQAGTLIGRSAVFLVGCVAVAIGIASLIISNYPILPFDSFVKEITRIKNINYAKFKTCFDLSAFTISLVLSIVLFGEIKGIHIGTFVSALILGTMIDRCIGFMNTYIEGTKIIPQEKVNAILDFDLINKKKTTKDSFY